MRYTRFEFKGNKKIGLREFILKFFVLIPLIGLTAGFIITRFIIVPYLFGIEKNVKQDHAEPAASIYSGVKAKRYYMIQTGVFTELNNANAFMDRLRSSNFPAYINAEEQYIIVFSYGSNSSSFTEKKMKDLKALKLDCIQKEININIDPVSEALETNRGFILAVKTLNSISDEIDSYCELLSRNESEDIDGSVLRRKYVEITKSIQGEISLFKTTGDNDLDNLSGVLEYFEAFVTLTEEIPASIAKHQEKLMEEIYLLKKIVDYLNTVSAQT